MATEVKGDFDSHIAGIPCRIQIDDCFIQKPLGPNCDSDWDCYGFEEVYFTVLDRNGYLANWLRKKMTVADEARITEECLEHCKGDPDDQP